MKITSPRSQAFTLVEMMIALAVGSLILAAIIGASISLQKSFSASDRFFSTHVQQVRIIDYVGRDVKRAIATYTSTNQQTITCMYPTYLQTSGPRMTPIVYQSATGMMVNYGRNAVVSTTSNSTTITTTTANFTAADVGSIIDGIPLAPPSDPTLPPTMVTITAVNSTTSATISSAATATLANLPTTVSPVSTVVYSVTGQTIVRTQTDNTTAVGTMIASSTDQLIEQGTDVTDDLRNTEYLDANVTFLPAYNYGQNPSATPSSYTTTIRTGTAVYGRAYLRNKRRG